MYCVLRSSDTCVNDGSRSCGPGVVGCIVRRYSSPGPNSTKEKVMINIQIRSDDHQGDMVPTPNSPLGGGNVPSERIVAPAALYSPGGTFRLTYLPILGAVIQCINDGTLVWSNNQLLDPRNPTQVQWVTIWTA